MAEKMDDYILTVFATRPDALDAADVLLILEERTGREFRLSAVFNCILDLTKAGVLVADRGVSRPTLYRLAALQKDTNHG